MMTMPLKRIGGANRRPASPLNARRQREGVSRTPPSLSAAVDHGASGRRVSQKAVLPAREILQTAFGSIVRLAVSQYTQMMTPEQRAAVVRYNKAAADFRSVAGPLDEQRFENLRNSYFDLYTAFGLHETRLAQEEQLASVPAIEEKRADEPAAANLYSGLAIIPPETLRQPASFAGNGPASQPSAIPPLSIKWFTDTLDYAFPEGINAGNSKIEVSPRWPFATSLIIPTVPPVILPVYDLNENGLDVIEQAWQEQETDRTLEHRLASIYTGIKFKPIVRSSFVPKAELSPIWLPDIIDEAPVARVAVAGHQSGFSQTIHNHANTLAEAEAPAPPAKPVGAQTRRTAKTGSSVKVRRPLAEIAQRAGRKFSVVKSGKGRRDFRFELPDETQLRGYKALATLWSPNHTPEENLEALLWLRNRTKEEREELAALMPERIPILEEMLAKMFPSPAFQVMSPSTADNAQISERSVKSKLHSSPTGILIWG